MPRTSSAKPGLTIARMPAAQTLLWAYEAPTTDPHDLEGDEAGQPGQLDHEGLPAPAGREPGAHRRAGAAAARLRLGGDRDDLDRPGRLGGLRRRERTLEDGEQVVLGFDGSYRRDATALAACTLDGFVSVVTWERPDGARPDWKVPRQEVDDAIAEAMERFDVLELACDPPGWHAEIEGWRESYGNVVVDFPTTERRRMAAACDRFRVAVLEGDLQHDGDPVLARHVGHCVAKETPYGTIVGKEHPD